MLQGICKHYLYSCYGLVTLVLSLTACKPDSSGFSEEKAAYLADYESPNTHWGYIDTTGLMAIDAIYDEVSHFSENKAAVNQKGLWGYIDLSGKLIINPQFRSAYSFHEDLARVKPFDLPECYITSTGRTISSTEWTATGDFSGGRAVVKVGTMYGFIDTAGKLVINPVYTRAWNFDHGRAVVEFQGKQGAIEANGNYIVQPHFDHLTNVGLFKMIFGIQENNAVLMDMDGNEMNRIAGAIARETDGKLVSLRKGGKMWLYQTEEKKFLPGNGFEQFIYLGEHRWAAKQDTLFQLLDDEGKILSPVGYAQINRFVNGMAAYHRDKFWGFMDTHGKELTEPIFGLVWDYSNGFARAGFKDGLAYINSQQEIAFYPPEGTVDMRDFREGLSPIQMMQQ